MLDRLRKSLKMARWQQQQPRRLLSAMSRVLRRGQSDGKATGSEQVPQRKEQVKSLQADSFDVLVIGGGAMGCGCALEAATRGFKTALIDAGDFASGASCKSSKLMEGSNSYLHEAIRGADLQQIFMLQQVLSERATMLKIAPHLNRVQPMLMPIYSPLRLPLYWLGLKIYDAMAGMSNVRGSHFMSKEATLNEFPLLRQEGLFGSLVYYDAQMDDARMCLALAMTAAKHGASVANYVRLTGLQKQDKNTDCRIARVKDSISNESFPIKSRVIINATGAGSDVIRNFDNCRSEPVVVPKMGTHITLPSYYGSSSCGLLLPGDKSGDSALIMMPFENSTLVGSMDVERSPENSQATSPNPNEVQCLLHQTRRALVEFVELRPDHVMSAWTGAKPVIICPSENENAEPTNVSNYLLEVSGNQMISLMGGRWNNYRLMAVDAINTAIESCQLEPHSKKSITESLLLDGADDYYCMLPLDLVQAYDLPMDVAQHLAESYGSNAQQMLAQSTNCSRKRLHPNFPYIEAEVTFACQREYACHLVDVIARRLRVAFVDVAAASEMLPTILNIMCEELCWEPAQKKRELKAAQQFLSQQMGLGCIVQPKSQSCCGRGSSLSGEDFGVDNTSQDCIGGGTNNLGTAKVIASDKVVGFEPTGSRQGIAVPLSAEEEALMQAQVSQPQGETATTEIAISGSAPISLSSVSVSSGTTPIRGRATPIRGGTAQLNAARASCSDRRDILTHGTTPNRDGRSSVSSDADRVSRQDDVATTSEGYPLQFEICSFSPYVIADSGPLRTADVSASVSNKKSSWHKRPTFREEDSSIDKSTQSKALSLEQQKQQYFNPSNSRSYNEANILRSANGTARRTTEKKATLRRGAAQSKQLKPISNNPRQNYNHNNRSALECRTRATDTTAARSLNHGYQFLFLGRAGNNINVRKYPSDSDTES